MSSTKGSIRLLLAGVAIAVLAGCAGPKQPSQFFREGEPRATMKLDTSVRDTRVRIAGKPYCEKLGPFRNSKWPTEEILHTRRVAKALTTPIPTGKDLSFSVIQPISDGEARLDFDIDIEPGAVYELVLTPEYGLFYSRKNFTLKILKDGVEVPFRRNTVDGCADDPSKLRIM